MDLSIARSLSSQDSIKSVSSKIPVRVPSPSKQDINPKTTPELQPLYVSWKTTTRFVESEIMFKVVQPGHEKQK